MSQMYKYFAFISYSRKDSKVAAWLQKRLEWFRFPVKLIPEDKRPPDPRYVRPIYRDKTNLEVTHEHYWKNIRLALEQSRFLIVLASPHSAKSQPVEMEVSHFLATHDQQPALILPVILSGRVTGTDSDAALCPTLQKFGEIITSRNLPTMVPDSDTAEQDAWEQGFAGIISYLLQLDRTAIGDHIQNEARKQARALRRWLVAVTILTITSLAGLAVAYKQKQMADAQTMRAINSEGEATQKKQEAEAQTLRALNAEGEATQKRKEAEAQALRALNAEKATQSQLIETNLQLDRSHVEEGRAWLERGRAALSDGYQFGALMLAGRAIGYQGYGRLDPEAMSLRDNFPLLLAKPMKDPTTEKERANEFDNVKQFIDSIRPTGLPLWIHSIPENITCVAFSPDGTRLAKGSGQYYPKRDITIKVWDASTGKQLASLAGHTDSARTLAFSPDATQLASGSEDHTLKLWDIATGKELVCLRGHSASVQSVAFSPDGTRLASGSSDKTIKLWNASSGKELRSLQGHTLGVESVMFSPDGSRLASGSNDKSIKLWNVPSGNEVTTLRGHTERVSSVAFNFDGTSLASSSGDKSIRLWNVANGREISNLHGHSEGISSVTFSPDGTRLASVSEDETVKIWDANAGHEINTMRRIVGSGGSVAFHPDGSRLAVGGGGNLSIWGATAGNGSISLYGHTDEVQGAAFSPDGTVLATCSDDDGIKLWDAVTGREVASLLGPTRGPICVAFSPDGVFLASGSRDGTTNLWNIATTNWLGSFIGHQGRILSVSFSQDGKFIATGSADETVKIWDVAARKERTSYRGHEREVSSVAFSPDSSLLASGSGDAKIKLWDIATEKELAQFAGHETSVRYVGFSPDGSKLASISFDRKLKLWDVVRGIEVTISMPSERFNALQWLDQSAQMLNISTHRAVQAGRAENIIAIVQYPSAPLDLTAPLRAGFATFERREVVIPYINEPPPMIHYRHDTLAQLADPKLPPERRADLRMELCAKSSQFRAATALWQRLLQGEWPGFEGATVPKDQAPATIPADSPIRRLYLLALIDATKHPQIHGHPTICQTASQITPVLTKEMMATPTISLAMMSLMQTLKKDDNAAMTEPRAALMKKLEDVATKEWLEVLRNSEL